MEQNNILELRDVGVSLFISVKVTFWLERVPGATLGTTKRRIFAVFGCHAGWVAQDLVFLHEDYCTDKDLVCGDNKRRLGLPITLAAFKSSLLYCSEPGAPEALPCLLHTGVGGPAASHTF